jgi:hypothetical protein
MEELFVMRTTFHELSTDCELLATLRIWRTGIIYVFTDDRVIWLLNTGVISVQKSTVGVAPLRDIIIVVPCPHGCRISCERITTWAKIGNRLLITDDWMGWLGWGLVHVLNFNIWLHQVLHIVKGLLKLCFFCHQAATLSFMDLGCLSKACLQILHEASWFFI